MAKTHDQTTVSDIMKPAVVIGEGATMREALEKMVREKSNSLLVIGEDSALSGEVSVSDLLDAVVPEYLDGDSVIDGRFKDEESFRQAVQDAADKPVVEFMSLNVESVQPDDSLIDVTATAIAMGQARIPVVDHENRPVGVISRQGLKKILADYLHVKE